MVGVMVAVVKRMLDSLQVSNDELQNNAFRVLCVGKHLHGLKRLCL